MNKSMGYMKTAVSRAIDCLALFFVLVIAFHVVRTMTDLCGILDTIIARKFYFFGRLLLVGAVIGIAGIYFAKRIQKIGFSNVFLPAVFFAYFSALLVGTFSIYSSNIVLKNDPKLYYDTAIALLNDIARWNVFDTYHRRVLFYTLPVLKFLHPTLLSVQIVNLAALLLTSTGYFYIVSKSFGRKAGLLFLFLFLIYPTHYFTIDIVSHDLIANFYLMLLMLSFYWLIRQTMQKAVWGKVFLLAFAVAVMWVINEFQRTTGFVILGTMIIFAASYMISNERSKKSVFFLIGLTSVLYLAINMTSYKVSTPPRIVNPQASFFCHVYSFNDLGTKGDFSAGEGEENLRDYHPLIFGDVDKRLTVTKYFSQIAHYPFETIKLVMAKSNVLLSDSPYNFTYMFKFKNKAQKALLHYLVLMTMFWRAVLILLAGIGILFAISDKSKPLMPILIFPLCFLFFMSFFQVNYYYSYLLIPPIIIGATLGVKYLFSPRQVNGIILNRRSIFISACQVAGTFMSVVFVIYAAAWGYLQFSPGKLIDFNKVNIIKTNTFFEKSAIRCKNAYTLKMKSDNAAAPVTVALEGVGNFKEAYFLAKTSLKPSQFKVYSNDQLAEIAKSKMGSSPDTADYYYIFFKVVNPQRSKNIMISISPLVPLSSDYTFEIKDLFLVSEQ